MPEPHRCWWHIVFNTFGSWYTGDPRGFRSRNHRKHSSGDYRQPPPPTGEHAGLHRFVRQHSRPPVRIPADLYEAVGEAVLRKIAEGSFRVLACSVDGHHVHLLVELPDDRRAVKRVVGRWKQYASHRVRDRLPGTVWSKSCDPVRVADREHYRHVFDYIRRHGDAGAWVWTFRDKLET